MDELICFRCGKKLGNKLMQLPEVKRDGKSYCANCAYRLEKDEEYIRAEQKRLEVEQERKAGIKNVILTTTDFLQGYKIEEYIDIITEEVVVLNGTRVSVPGDDIIADGNKLTVMDQDTVVEGENEIKIGASEYAELFLKLKLKRHAFENNGNAVIGLQFSEFTYHNIIAGTPNIIIRVRGTIVRTRKEE